MGGGNARNGAALGGRAPTITGNQTRLRPNLDATGRAGGSGIIAGDRQLAGSGQGAGGGRGTGALHVPFAGRMTPNDLGKFLSLPNRGGSGSGLANGSARGTQVINASRHTASNFRNLPVSQLNRIQTNVNGAFRNTSFVNVNRFNNGFGFGFGGNPYWNNWAGGIRSYCNFNRFNGCFNNRFWATNYCHFPWRRSYYWWGSQPWSYWWGCPTWGGLNGWFGNYWGTPYYYGYGPGGNVVFNSGYVYLNDEPIATVEDYAASAAALADAPPPANPDQPTEWMPLGTFTLSEGEEDKDPSRVIQLAVDKEGYVSGTMTNQKTNQTLPVQGRVDKETQRVAFTIGNEKEVVFETGIYNLTQQQTPLLAHGEGREETYLLLRLDPPKTDEAPPPPPATEEPKSLLP
jgi:hypothetical protein